MTMPHMMNCGHSDTGWCLDCVRELHDRAEKADAAAEVLGQRALNIERRWMETFEKRAARENEMIGEAIDDFCDAVLGKLKELGVPETDNCDGDDDVETIFASWIHARLLDARDEGALAGRAAGAGVGLETPPTEKQYNNKLSV